MEGGTEGGREGRREGGRQGGREAGTARRGLGRARENTHARTHARTHTHTPAGRVEEGPDVGVGHHAPPRPRVEPAGPEPARWSRPSGHIPDHRPLASPARSPLMA